MAQAGIPDTEIGANAWSDSARCPVEMRLNGEGPWVAMERYIGPDPNFQRPQTLNAFIPEELGREVPPCSPSPPILTSQTSLREAPRPKSRVLHLVYESRFAALRFPIAG
ncbi:MAG: hypothetical protein ACLFU6_06565 [Candidatus Hydrogenedentota bacterium]